jgi:hypothetical protein
MSVVIESDASDARGAWAGSFGNSGRFRRRRFGALINSPRNDGRLVESGVRRNSRMRRVRPNRSVRACR